MKVRILDVNYIIDGKLSVTSTKMFYEQRNKDEMRSIHYEVQLNNQRFRSKASDVTEFAIKNLQKELPTNISIACCQSCRHGNFCPYGDDDDEVYCLKDKKPNSKGDVVELFSTQDKSMKSRSRKLLDFCNDYKIMAHTEYYTYNDWGL
ncbi:hypothetical protein [Paenibacillus tianmuensis]|uniref:hypothetical protein n=1 Tax=Paenibacillus tianmuensis TaxID=624147 RepID=UPI00115FCBAD|nr:hypothetical protein [Paenibacillus tianmuensis]